MASNLIRAANDRAAFDALTDRGPLTRPEIGALLGLSKPTASQLLIRLQEAGLVIPEGIREGGPGRAAELYRINPGAAHIACFDVTPERIEALVADVSGTVIGRHTAAGDGIEALQAAFTATCAAAGLAPTDITHSVVGVQGAVDPATGRLGYAAHMPGWQIPALPDALQDLLGTPVAVENDVNLVAMAELAHGAARGTRNFVLLWAADGLGMAVVINGALYRGATGGAGEIGYMPVPGAAMPHPSERRTADYGFHALAGGPAIREVLRAHGFHGATPAAAIGAAARVWGIERAHAAYAEIADRIAVGLAAVVSVLDPETIILSGDVLTTGGEPLRALLEQRLAQLSIPRPAIRMSTVDGNPVLGGALVSGVAHARDHLFA
ncbi:MAG: ROK family transcriptional regulator [Hamadaea sp.]|nr:ROK family transcriptional regulator [Hamadaea sp.]